MRKLATIERISAINPHPNADSLELATVKGWQVCVKKGEFFEKPKGCVPGLCVYVEIDSVLPERPEFEFMRDRKWRVKTIRLRGELSQGICFPLSILPDDSWKEGDDVTEELDITIYQPPIPVCLGGDVEGEFPSFLRKTDCERIQNFPWLLGLPDTEWVATEKLDGSSLSAWWKDGKLHVASRNWEMREAENNAYWQAAKYIGLADKLKGSHIALQGELLGPKIQGNRYGMKRPTLFFFDAYNMEQQRYLNFDDFQLLCDHLDLETAPLICRRAKLIGRSITEVLLMAEDKSQLNDKAEREGLVWKPMIEKFDTRMGRVAFKAISNKFLLRGGE